MILVALSLLVTLALGAGPECRYACDDPISTADCHPVCRSPRCQTDCPFELTAGQRALLAPLCRVRCPFGDQLPTDACPSCEVVCAPPPTVASSGCSILCEALDCGWECKLPANPPHIRCQLQCEQPVCQLTVAGRLPLQTPSPSAATAARIK